MKKILAFLGIVLCCSLGIWYLSYGAGEKLERPNIGQLAAIEELFPRTQEEIELLVSCIMSETKAHLDKMIENSSTDRTFENTFTRLDVIVHRFIIVQNSLYVLSLVSPDKSVRLAAQNAVQKLQGFSVDMVSQNKNLYKACRDYIGRLTDKGHEELERVQQYFMNETMKDFKRTGLELPPDQQERISAINKEIAQIALAYDTGYSGADSDVTVSQEALKGLEQSFIKSLNRTPEGLYRIPLSYDKFYPVLEHCEDQETRRKVFRAFMLRGYPDNEKRLTRVLALTDELAHLLGFAHYDQLSLDNQMAGSPGAVEDFLMVLYKRAHPKAMKEMEVITSDLHPSVHLEGGKIQPWDLPFAYSYYKKKHLFIDEALVSQYFPVQKTIAALLKIYEDFFGLCITPIKKTLLWHEDVQALAVYRHGKYLGMILLDLLARPDKFSHASHMTVVPSVLEPSGKVLPAVVVVVANFSQDHKDRPAVLTRKEVLTFFHECGHAFHALLGSTRFASLSGTAVKGDFVEMPSQMLEEWLWDHDILKSISSHLITHEPLPDDLIKKILAIKNYDTGDFMLRQIFLAQVSLALYGHKGQQSIAQLWKRVHERVRPYSLYDGQSKGYCSFPHIMGYGPRYYGYLWSKVYALDLFSHIRPFGLRNPLIGELYIEKILGKGGSQDPYELLESFLGRKPSTDAFFKDLGL